MNISQNGLNLIETFEGYRELAYYDTAGVLTIGYGHTNNTASASQYPVYEGETMTRDLANKILLTDVSNYVTDVNNAVTVQINQNQFDALVSFTYNLGVGTLYSSDLLTYVNEGNFGAAAQQFLLYVHSNGRVLPGLVNRRTQERALFLSDSNTSSYTPSTPNSSVNNGLINYSGVFIPNQTLQVSADTDPNSPAIATYDAGEQIPYDSYTLVNGYAWISYIGQSGQRRYVAVGPDDGSSSTTWGTGFFN
ncbi:glycoside hydrolase family protein [Fructobacillus cardui]|uniref:Lysozyme n=1 Tax=Fructobacillus cardui TaxID=2893170 RepID=A0ABN9Z1X0_9LACO|nr:GH24 family (RrrD) [Fructobacillus cardui]